MSAENRKPTPNWRKAGRPPMNSDRIRLPSSSRTNTPDARGQRRRRSGRRCWLLRRLARWAGKRDRLLHECVKIPVGGYRSGRAGSTPARPVSSTVATTSPVTSSPGTSFCQAAANRVVHAGRQRNVEQLRGDVAAVGEAPVEELLHRGALADVLRVGRQQHEGGRFDRPACRARLVVQIDGEVLHLRPVGARRGGLERRHGRGDELAGLVLAAARWSGGSARRRRFRHSRCRRGSASPCRRRRRCPWRRRRPASLRWWRSRPCSSSRGSACRGSR